MPLPLEPHASGEEVRDLHRRLASAGYPSHTDTLDRYGAETVAAVCAFQLARGLASTGTCDMATWSHLVEAGFRLGDRLLYLHSPMLRGDDVADLQLRLGSLGFDAGRIDGIFGVQTERALAEFQRNAGLPTDAIAGQETIRELSRLGAKTDLRDPVAVVREREHLRRTPRSLVGRRIVLGEFGGSAALVLATARHLRELAASVVTLHHPDSSRQAADTNAAEAEMYLAVQTCAEPECTALYFATTGYVSEGGKRLAELVALAMQTTLLFDCITLGSRTSVLRETRMPAVHLRVGPASTVSTQLATLAVALATATERWFVEPLDESHPQPQPLLGP